jgi:hypothetical protein
MDAPGDHTTARRRGNSPLSMTAPAEHIRIVVISAARRLGSGRFAMRAAAGGFLG